MHHGGVFVKFPGRQYVRGKTQFIDLVDSDKFSVNELHDMMVEIGYKSSIPTYFHFKFPGKDLDVGLHALGSDAKVIEMLKLVFECKLFDIYTEQWESRLNTYNKSPGGNKVDEEKGKEVIEINEKDESALENDYNQMEGNPRSDESDEDDFIEETQNVVDKVEVDMKTFKANTDLDVEWIGHEDLNNDDSNVSGDVDAVDMEELESNTDDYDMEKERKTLLKKLRKEKASVFGVEESPCFYVGKVFGRKDGIKRGSQPEMNKEYEGGPNIAASGTDKGKRKEVKSSGTPCPWVLLISKGKNDATWMVKTFVDTHKCLETREVKACIASFLSQEIVDTISNNPEIPVKALKINIERKYGQKFSHMKSFRAKTMVLSKVRGNYAKQYNHLRDYVLELQRVMPETTVKLDVEHEPNVATMECIREYLMKRITNVQKVINKSDGVLTPTATKVLDSIKREATKYTVLWNGGCKYQVTGPWLDQCVVDVQEKFCTCRRWELIGIPCKHAVVVIWNMCSHGANVDIPEFWVHET
ncbi:hypothetical protein L6452_01036 [Arctium lappa]|uniref:Uncharacterized protein n=1 Tax=Arctium lappa TaxID=4217 RepID=A0ACB9FFJ5_ARCLA|nr:hypothetical protein L6452_01036 [Arctium lappa]